MQPLITLLFLIDLWNLQVAADCEGLCHMKAPIVEVKFNLERLFNIV